MLAHWCVFKCNMAGLWRFEDNLAKSVLLSTMKVLGVELRLSGLVARAFNL